MLHADCGPFGSVREEDDAHTGILTKGLIDERVSKDSSGLVMLRPGCMNKWGKVCYCNIPGRYRTSKVKAMESERPIRIFLRRAVRDSLSKEWAVDLQELEFCGGAKGFKRDRRRRGVEKHVNDGNVFVEEIPGRQNSWTDLVPIGSE